jgi:outer membrane protein
MLKKYSIFFCCTLFSPFFVFADTLGLEVGVTQWNYQYSGNIASLGEAIDIEQTLGFSKENQPEFWLSLEHPIPLLPNIKVMHTSLQSISRYTIKKHFTFNQKSFEINSNIRSEINLTNTEAVFYYEFLDNWLNLDLGLTLRYYDGFISLEDSNRHFLAKEAYSVVVPLIYIKAKADLPFSGFFLESEMNVIKVSNDSLSDLSIAMGYETALGFGAKLGYKTFSMDINENNLQIDLEAKGIYASFYFHF